MGALGYAIQLLGILPQMLSAGLEIKTLITTHQEKLKVMQAEDRAPTLEEWRELDAVIKNLRDQLHS